MTLVFSLFGRALSTSSGGRVHIVTTHNQASPVPTTATSRPSRLHGSLKLLALLSMPGPTPGRHLSRLGPRPSRPSSGGGAIVHNPSRVSLPLCCSPRAPCRLMSCLVASSPRAERLLRPPRCSSHPRSRTCLDVEGHRAPPGSFPSSNAASCTFSRFFFPSSARVAFLTQRRSRCFWFSACRLSFKLLLSGSRRLFLFLL